MITQPAELSAQQLDLPPSIRRAYDISDEAEVEKLSGGLVNETLRIHYRGEFTIMRRLAPIMDDSLLEDAQVVGSHLVRNGWEAPVSIPTIDGATHTRDEANTLWHRMRFIQSDGKTPELNTGLAASAGSMIGGWHATMQRLIYEPKFSIANFHNTDYYAHKLGQQLSVMEADKPVHALATGLINNYRRLGDVPYEPQQLIHGDPKLDNMLYRDGKPFTLIDFDTIMRASPWVDVGDFLRSLTGKLLEHAAESRDQFVAAYHESNELALSLDEATNHARLATGRIALELGMRYLSDIVDGKKYFNWDPTKHENRRDHHLERAELQIRVASMALEAA